MFALFLIGLAAVGAGCESSSAAGPGGRGGTSGTGSGGSGVLSCSGTPTGCLCIGGDSEPGQLTSCSMSSVVTSEGQQGVCCQGPILCYCDAYLCKHDMNAGYCECGTAFVVNMDVANGMVVQACPAPTAQQKCCFLESAGTCTCSTLDCEDATPVPSCSLATVTLCQSDEQSLNACK